MRSAHFLVYEHQRLTLGSSYPTPGGSVIPFEEHHLEALGRYQERTGSTAFKLIHRGIQLRHHVGYLRVGPVSLEIYPKLGRDGPQRDWRGLLFHMLRTVSGVRFTTQDQAPLKPRAGDLYEVLLRRFLDQTEALLREGLARSYREVEENGSAFRGRLLIGPHLRENCVRKERFFVAYEVHDTDNLPNRALHRALSRVLRTAPTAEIAQRAEAALTDFPEVSPAPIRASDWGAMRLDRRAERYREALALARMILRDERPDLRWGDQEVIALLFDMNALFEAYLEAALRGLPGCRVVAQRPLRFWTPTAGAAASLKPDILLYMPDDARPVVIDAKWKIPPRDEPADDDLRQLFAYLHAVKGRAGALIYPRASPQQTDREGVFLDQAISGRMHFLELFSAGKPDLVAVREALSTSFGRSGAGLVSHDGAA